MSFGYQVLGFGSGSAAYAPGMMTHDGASWYSDATVTYSGNLVTTVARFNVASFSGAGVARINNFRGVVGRTRISPVLYSNDHATTANRNKLRVLVYNDAGAIIGDLLTDVDVCDGSDTLVFAAYDADNGTAILYIDGVDADDTGYASRTLNTGTLAAASGDAYVASINGSVQFVTGDIGYCGYRDAYLTNPTDFYHPTNGLQVIDESGWTQWGAQPLFWNQYGTMTDNKGSAGNMTANGTITGPA